MGTNELKQLMEDLMNQSNNNPSMGTKEVMAFIEQRLKQNFQSYDAK